MQHDFWHQSWAKSDSPGWQQDQVNRHLIELWNVDPAETAFVPLCGRSLDMQWLRERGHHVIGVDLSVAALEQFCKQQSITPEREQQGELTVFHAPGWTLYAGDFFALEASHLKGVSVVYDRAALIALPEDMRADYAAHLQSILPVNSKMFVITIDYDQNEMKGPPFSVSKQEFEHLYSESNIQILESGSEPERLGNLAERGLTGLTETCYLVEPKV